MSIWTVGKVAELLKTADGKLVSIAIKFMNDVSVK
jgi:hypothetical protein